jgi:hypothetical protein
MLLCGKCHDKAHKNSNYCNPKKHPPKKLQTELGILNSTMKRMFKDISDYFSTQETFGYITKLFRRKNNIEKSHSIDAEIIAMSDCYANIDFSGYNVKKYNNNLTIRQYRRHKRAWVQRHEDRKYYLYGIHVANNRRKKTEQTKDKLTKQTKDSLTEYRKKYKDRQLFIHPGKKVYFKPASESLFRPGDIVQYNGNVYDVCKGWYSTQRKVNLEENGEVLARKCKVIRNNSGLVYM